MKMGRKAKDAAQKKISEWTGVHRNVSKVEEAPNISTTTTTKTTKTKPATVANENVNTSNENRSVLQTHSQSELNAMKNCTVRLEKIQLPSKRVEPQQQNEVVVKKMPTLERKIPAATAAAATTAIAVEDKRAATEKIYDYSFDAELDDAFPLPSHDMKDVFEKLAKENKIEVKKYRQKNVKKQKTTDDKGKPAKKATVTRKRPREKIQATSAEQPPQKRPNLKKNKVMNIDDIVVTDKQQKLCNEPVNAVTNKAPIQITADIGISTAKKVTILEDIVIRPVEEAIAMNNDNVQSRLRNRVITKFQSTPKSSTPLSTKSMANTKGNERMLNSLFFGNASPLNDSTRPTHASVLKQRLHMSGIVDSDAESSAHNAQENDAPVQQMDFFDDDDGIDFASVQQSKFIRSKEDKENSLDRPVLSSSTATNQPQASTSAAVTVQNQHEMRALAPNNKPETSTSAARLTQSRFGPSVVASTSRNNSADISVTSNNYSNFEMHESSDYNQFSPTKRRVYNRSPLKNITSEVNNTNSSSFQLFKLPAALPRSYGVLKKSTLNSNSSGHSSVESNISLPEVSHFKSRRGEDDFDRTMNDSNLMDNCFGFGDDNEDDEIDNNNDTLVEQSKSLTISKSKSGALNEIRARLKRFLHNPDAADDTIKRTKATDKHTKKRAINTPSKTPAKKTDRTPIKRNVVFIDTGAKQKDIRSVITAKMQQNKKQTTTGVTGPITLFEEDVPKIQNQDRRRSYSRPQRQRKRRISIDSEHSEEEEEEQHSDDEELDGDGKLRKRAKRRKKTTEPNLEEKEEFDEFVQKLNSEFEDIDNFQMCVE